MKIDSGGEDDFEDIEDNMHEKIRRFTCSMTLPQTSPVIQTSINYTFLLKFNFQIISYTYIIIQSEIEHGKNKDESTLNSLIKEEYNPSISSKQETTYNTGPSNISNYV